MTLNNIQLIILQKFQKYLTDDILDTSVEATNFKIQYINLCEPQKISNENRIYIPCKNFFFRVLNLYSIYNLLKIKNIDYGDEIYLKKHTISKILEILKLNELHYELHTFL